VQAHALEFSVFTTLTGARKGLPSRFVQSFRTVFKRHSDIGTADCSVGQPEAAGYVLTAVAPMRAQCTWEVYGGVGLMRMSQQHKQRQKGRGLASLRLHADLKHHRVGTVSYARQTLCYLDF